MNCPHCGFGIEDSRVICPICKKLTRPTAWIQIIKSPQGDPEMKIYSCPFCSGRRVKEVIRGENRLHEVLYYLDKKLVFGHDGLRHLDSPVVEKTICLLCDMELPREDQETFFEESESWLPQ